MTHEEMEDLNSRLDVRNFFQSISKDSIRLKQVQLPVFQGFPSNSTK